MFRSRSGRDPDKHFSPRLGTLKIQGEEQKIGHSAGSESLLSSGMKTRGQGDDHALQGKKEVALQGASLRAKGSTGHRAKANLQ
ncbi:hypothetical protein llap_19250 [Limosa lapponica baueri]|uniref:Uncharacterized protein n=1 Tax=Limosa lapponica baueri TaxID=1758121 RepID=A0A2I0T9J3_LIMLA|nr:hypothetical protein llap_19250 [Limosa lapponica baueri]